MSIRNRVKHLLQMCGHAFFSTMHERLDAMERQARNASFPETQASLLQASIHTVEKLHELTDHVVVETDDYKALHPEIGLMDFLYSYVPGRKVTGAVEPRAAEHLRAVGYEVSCSKGPVMLDAEVAVVDISCDVKEMRARGFHWHIVIHHDPASGKTAFYSNHVPVGVGSVFVFRDYGTFCQAQAWCAAVLPKTYFKPASSMPRS